MPLHYYCHVCIVHTIIAAMISLKGPLHTPENQYKNMIVYGDQASVIPLRLDCIGYEFSWPLLKTGLTLHAQLSPADIILLLWRRSRI